MGHAGKTEGRYHLGILIVYKRKKKGNSIQTTFWAKWNTRYTRTSMSSQREPIIVIFLQLRFGQIISRLSLPPPPATFPPNPEQDRSVPRQPTTQSNKPYLFLSHTHSPYHLPAPAPALPFSTPHLAHPLSIRRIPHQKPLFPLPSL